jgi:DNA-binding transcriptional ArsR family regulator
LLAQLGQFDGDRLALTDRGIDLARFKNPILDEDLRRAASTLSDDERSFFTQEILQYVPGELGDIRLVLGAVLGGKTTPDELLTAVRPLLHGEWSAVMVRTHVSGVVARLTEMGLLRRRWEGRNVNYEASGMASTLLTKEQAATHDQTH